MWVLAFWSEPVKDQWEIRAKKAAVFDQYFTESLFSAETAAAAASETRTGKFQHKQTSKAEEFYLQVQLWFTENVPNHTPFHPNQL